MENFLRYFFKGIAVTSSFEFKVDLLFHLKFCSQILPSTFSVPITIIGLEFNLNESHIQTDWTVIIMHDECFNRFMRVMEQKIDLRELPMITNIFKLFGSKMNSVVQCRRAEIVVFFWTMKISSIHPSFLGTENSQFNESTMTTKAVSQLRVAGGV